MWNKVNHVLPGNSRLIQIYADCKTGPWAWNGDKEVYIGFYMGGAWHGIARKGQTRQDDGAYLLTDVTHWTELADAPTDK